MRQQKKEACRQTTEYILIVPGLNEKLEINIQLPKRRGKQKQEE